ncbi:hypothetical protein TREMEDRAFT_66413 [Tremella mesenterica DSM 1558]|uniref:uncharacterized protein n=1 Tax=Tremella mesenterica (strain ATCC 24925 / CBS 8224 / DSM 1558 / NBRC 9311 / NRRL Y-6157 / RJB 2259-6 / UBC 559-6) TaxID=578456 RepID=UPI00032C2F3F|nr:uncharacterized protein TREMEDRAFT_66413 [Tremella mesenterica DSM 1558]EIW65582.1 hypothetical protein TREMEDRAFT_66413 [Tremella mesenterica DSM 1558]
MSPLRLHPWAEEQDQTVLPLVLPKRNQHRQKGNRARGQHPPVERDRVIDDSDHDRVIDDSDHDRVIHDTYHVPIPRDHVGNMDSDVLGPNAGTHVTRSILGPEIIDSNQTSGGMKNKLTFTRPTRSISLPTVTLGRSVQTPISASELDPQRGSGGSDIGRPVGDDGRPVDTVISGRRYTARSVNKVISGKQYMRGSVNAVMGKQDMKEIGNGVDGRPSNGFLKNLKQQNDQIHSVSDQLSNIPEPSDSNPHVNEKINNLSFENPNTQQFTARSVIKHPSSVPTGVTTPVQSDLGPVDSSGPEQLDKVVITDPIALSAQFDQITTATTDRILIAEQPQPQLQPHRVPLRHHMTTNRDGPRKLILPMLIKERSAPRALGSRSGRSGSDDPTV